MGVDPEAVKKFREAQPYARRWKSGNLHADPLSFLTLKRLFDPQSSPILPPCQSSRIGPVRPIL